MSLIIVIFNWNNDHRKPSLIASAPPTFSFANITWVEWSEVDSVLSCGIGVWFGSYFILSAIVCPWLNCGLPPCCPQVVWCHCGEIGPFSATLAQDGLAECDRPGKNPLEYSAEVRNWTRATGRTDSELSHWAIMTDIGSYSSCKRFLSRHPRQLWIPTLKNNGHVEAGRKLYPNDALWEITESKTQYTNFCEPLRRIRVPLGYLQAPDTGQNT